LSGMGLSDMKNMGEHFLNLTYFEPWIYIFILGLIIIGLAWDIFILWLEWMPLSLLLVYSSR
jgi:hypothetical protein